MIAVRARIEEVDGIGAGLYPHVVYAAQMIVRMAVHGMPSPGRIQIGPAASDLGASMAGPEIGEHAVSRLVDAVHEFAELM